VVRGLYEHRLGTVAWTAGMAVLAIVFVQVTKTIVEPLLAIRALAPYFAAFLHGNVYAAFLGFTWFNVAQLLLAGFAITQAARWSAEDIDGRLEITLSQPRSRASVVLERMTVLTVSAIVIATISGVAVFYASRAQGINLDQARLAEATLMLVPFALVFAAAGSLLAAWNPRAAVGLLGILAFVSYLDTEVGSIFKLPLWVQDLSAFKLFGTPLVSGVDSRNLALLLLIAIAGVGSSILAVGRRDVAA
jgi:ABC-2 type transport system permease protein